MNIAILTGNISSDIEVRYTYELSDTERGASGYGSTGK